MLSSENPPPQPQPPSPAAAALSEKLKSDDEKKGEVADLLLKCSDDNSHTHPNKFSIRDYVFSARGKDIKAHWPFSPENLQICLKNGVKEVLPPFETLETVKNPPPFVKRDDEYTGNLISGLISSKNAGLELASGDAIENFKSNSPKQDEEYYSDVNPVPFQTKSPFAEAKKPITTVRAAGKARSKITSQTPGKKCRLIVKLGNNNISEPKSNEWDFSEAMASSKVCPVCKTFTSSSNTTLNAHIDQCLSGESKVKRTEDQKEVMIKHRIIKPRKVRVIVDIYKTALSCTLEDLDRRNGTNWASNLSFPALDQKNNDNKRYSIISEEKKEEGDVYIDSNGTKVRILSKLSNMNLNTNGEDDCRPRKPLERDKVSKIFPCKMKKKPLDQRENILKCPPYKRRGCSPRPGHCREEVKFPPEENEKDDSAQPLKAACHEHAHEHKHGQMKSNSSGLIKQWTGSKRTTGHKKKIKPDQKSHNPDKSITMKNSRIKSHQLPSLDDYKLVKRTRDLRLPISTSDNINPNPLSASESHKRKESMEQQPCLTNRVGYSLFDSQDFHCDEKTKNNHMILLHKRKEKETSSPTVKKFKRLSPSSKNLMPIRHKSSSESKKCLGRINRLNFKKSSAYHVENNKEETRIEEDSDSSSFDHRDMVLKIRKSRWDLLNSTSPKHSYASSESESYGFEHNNDSFVGDNCILGGMSDSLNAGENRDEFVSELISKISGGEPLISYGESLAYDEEMLCAGKDLVAEVNGNEGEEGSYFVDVDPIPIPGPPGSFLPSPGRMDSEEVQGNSSLTSCRIHSSGNEHELIDRVDSSESPISGASFVSNSIAFRSHDVPRVVECPNPIGASTDSPKAKSVFPESRFPIGGECESLSPSTPNPILRLMGKNLMVVNKEEDCVQKISPLPAEFPNGRPCAGDEAITFSRNPSVLENAQHFDFASNIRTSPQLFAPHHQQSRSVLSGMTSGREGSASSMDCHGYTFSHDVGKAHNTPSIPRLWNPHSCSDGRKGVIVMNDLSVNESGLRGFRTTYPAGNMHVGPRYYGSRYADPFSASHQSLRYNPLCSGSQMGQHANNYDAPPGHGMNNGNPITWSRTPEGPSASAGHERSSFYSSTGVSLPTKFT